MIYFIPLKNPITKAVYGTFMAGVAFMAFVQEKPLVGLLFGGIAAFVFWNAAQQWKAANSMPASNRLPPGNRQ